MRLYWNCGDCYGFVFTRTDSQGEEITRSGSGNNYIDNSVKLGETYTYSVRPILWNGTGNAAEVSVVVPKEIQIPPAGPKPEISITSLKPVSATCGWGTYKVNKSIVDKPMVIDGQPYSDGIGVHASSSVVYEIPENSARFVATVGLDDNPQALEKRSVTAQIWTDVCEMGEKEVFIAESPRLSNSTVKMWRFNLPLDIRAKRIKLKITDASDGIDSDHADWVDAGFLTK